MTEYWVSGAKFWCRYCKVFITDNKVTKRTHENGKKHKEKVEEYLQQVRKEQQQQTREQNALEAEIKRIQKAGIEAYRTQDVPTGFYADEVEDFKGEQQSNDFLSSIPIHNEPPSFTTQQQQITNETIQDTTTDNQIESSTIETNNVVSETVDSKSAGEPGQWTSVIVRTLESSDDESEGDEEEEEEVKKPIKIEFTKKRISGSHYDGESDDNEEDTKAHDPSFWSKKRALTTQNPTTKISFQLKKEDEKAPVKKEEVKEEEKAEEEEVKIEFKKRKSGNQQFRRKVTS
eukprot:TRINITY_DN4815_c0_g7_i1.p1 TRINITY_DN4815_c0_g7~~TRINITY_DN4815_c0_g7_i1.p1  ORF type:complete len:289 (+),score=92.95 TRINITY_DN4815_c0_g7_i1:93-959(+)